MRPAPAARADDVLRINAAAALLALLRHEVPLEVSLSAEAGGLPPSESEWGQVLIQL